MVTCDFYLRGVSNLQDLFHSLRVQTRVAQVTVSMYKSDMSSSQSARCVGFKKFFICELSASSSSDNYCVLGCNAV